MMLKTLLKLSLFLGFLLFHVIGAEEESEESGWESNGSIPPNVVFVLTALASCGLGWTCREDLRILAMLLMWTFTFAVMISTGSLVVTYGLIFFDFCVYRFILYPVTFKD
eukprot:CAMPEP_0184489162 /NCGR_PEP_ID=MMETSP0113_2-20130426/14631_1 /TAXON_ID=91329 /ORGANISM="Norrisiella sphaerica, Strain BC52" /LENGTH=109 /DNA_ID=CAMNT_0026872419 /DNA_START=201 /DNA_END=530 /DNA_ORIENTATION=+